MHTWSTTKLLPNEVTEKLRSSYSCKRGLKAVVVAKLRGRTEAERYGALSRRSSAQTMGSERGRNALYGTVLVEGGIMYRGWCGGRLERLAIIVMYMYVCCACMYGHFVRRACFCVFGLLRDAGVATGGGAG